MYSIENISRINLLFKKMFFYYRIFLIFFFNSCILLTSLYLIINGFLLWKQMAAIMPLNTIFLLVFKVYFRCDYDFII